jgi:hypothetical protein
MTPGQTVALLVSLPLLLLGAVIAWIFFVWTNRTDMRIPDYHTEDDEC